MKLVRLGEVCESITYGVTASAVWKNDGPRFLRITDLSERGVFWEKVPSCITSAREETSCSLKDGDIVVARTGGTVGKSFLVCDPPTAVFASYLLRVRCKHEVLLPEYAHVFMQSGNYWKQLLEAAQGAAQPNVNSTTLADIRLPLVSLSEQADIARNLTCRLNAIRKAEVAARMQLADIKALFQKLLQETLKQYNTCRLEEMALIIPGRHIEEANHNRRRVGVPYITGPSDFGAIQATPSRWTEKPDSMCSPNDVLVVVKGAGVANANLAPSEPACIGRQVMAIRALEDKASPAFIFFALMSARDRLRSDSIGATVPGLSIEHLAKLEIPQLSVPDQKLVTARLEKILKTISEAEEASRRQVEEYKILPQKILAKAFES